MARRVPVLMLVGVSAFTACRWEGTPGDDTGTVGVDTADADTDTDADTDSDTDADTDSDTDADTDTDPAWIVETERDTRTYGELGIEIISYAMTADSPSGYRDPDGADPVFHVIRPATFTEAGPRPLLVWLHGSAQGVDDDDARDDRCSAAGIAAVVSDALTEKHFIAGEVANREWIWVVPENPWCDLWTGLGDADPVDPDHHGAEHVTTVIDALVAGVGGVSADPEKIYGWGTSIGGAGIVTSAGGDTPSRFAAVVVDSGPINPVSWYALPSQAPYLDHIFGGAPTDEGGEPSAFYENYARADAPLLVTEGGYRVPTFVAYNQYDTLVPSRQNEAFGEALAATFPAAGIPYFIHDFAHHAPSNSFHVQTGYERPPFSYTNRAAFAFLEGAEVYWFEAEDTCRGDCTRAEESGGGTLEESSAYSQGAAIVRDAAAGAGTMYTGELPGEIPRGRAVTVLPVIAGEDLGDAAPGDAVVTFSLREDGAEFDAFAVTRGDLAAGSAETHAAYYAQVGNTTWSAGTLPEGTLSITAAFAGAGKVWLDGFWVIVE